MKHNKTLAWLNNATIILLLVALAFRAGASFEWLFPKEEVAHYALSDVQAVFPKAQSYVQATDKSVRVLNADKKQIGTLLCSSDFEQTQFGYNGDVPILIAINADNEIQSVHALKNSENKEYFQSLEKQQLFSQWNGLKLDSLAVQKQVDAVSGATLSSSAVITGVQHTLASYLDVQHAQQTNWQFWLRMILMALIMISALAQVFSRQFKKYYYYHLTAVAVVMGLWLKKMFSLDLLYTWLGSGLPWQSNLDLIIILLVSICLGLWGKQKFYCNYFCPMGAVQLLVAKLSPFKKRNFPKQVFNLDLRLIYLVLVWSLLILGFSLPLAQLEPFQAFSYQVASWFTIGFGIVVVILSLFFNRPWCALCPTGCALNTFHSIKK